MTMLRSLLLVSTLAAAGLQVAGAQPEVRVEPSNLKGPRPLEDQTRAAAIRDYLKSWQSFRAAFNQNSPDILDADFVGTAKDKLAETIQQQSALGIRTRYQDLSH